MVTIPYRTDFQRKRFARVWARKGYRVVRDDGRQLFLERS